MPSTPTICSFERVIPMIYAYTHPDVPAHQGWTKIGYTEKQTVKARIRQQNQTSDIPWELLWQDNAMYKDGSGEYFTDHDFHHYLEFQRGVRRKPKTEWFQIDGEDSHECFNSFASRKVPAAKTGFSYTLRAEQNAAVKMTMEYFKDGGTEFLWNAKPRFGKTLTAYDLIQRMDFQKVLIVTNRPSIANSWVDDFLKFVAWRDRLCFVSYIEVMRRHPVAMSREEYLSFQQFEAPDEQKGMIAFESLQGLKDSV